MGPARRRDRRAPGAPGRERVMNFRALLPWGRSRDRREEELDAELAAHLRMAEAERDARGESPEDAAANARREFGNVGLVKQTTREMWGGLWLERLAQDLRFGLRMLRRSPGFSILAVFCLTLGIGSNAAVYSWIEDTPASLRARRRPGPDGRPRRQDARRDGPYRPLVARPSRSAPELHAVRVSRLRQDHRHDARRRRPGRARVGPDRVGELLRGDRRPPRSGARIRAGRRDGTQRPSGRRDRLQDVEGPFPERSRDPREGAAHGRGAAHDHRRGPGGIQRHVRRVSGPVLGPGVHGGVRPGRLQAR